MTTELTPQIQLSAAEIFCREDVGYADDFTVGGETLTVRHLWRDDEGLESILFHKANDTTLPDAEYAAANRQLDVLVEYYRVDATAIARSSKWHSCPWANAVNGKWVSADTSKAAQIACVLACLEARCEKA